MALPEAFIISGQKIMNWGGDVNNCEYGTSSIAHYLRAVGDRGWLLKP